MKTPYDAEIERIWGTYKAAGPKAKAEEDRLCLLVLRAKAEGYRRAKTEDADLLEAAKSAYYEGTGGEQRSDSTGTLSPETVDLLEAAIAKATP